MGVAWERASSEKGDDWHLTSCAAGLVKAVPEVSCLHPRAVNKEKKLGKVKQEEAETIF